MTTNLRSLANPKSLQIAALLLSRGGALRRGEIQHALGTHPNMTAHHLERAARDGLIVKELTRIAAPARPVYSLTALGREYAALAAPLMAWIDAHQADIEAARATARGLREANRAEALLAEHAA